jgi:hypothetical protein
LFRRVGKDRKERLMNTHLKECLSAIAITAMAPAAFAADDAKSLLPAFGPEGAVVSTTAQNGHTVTGWVPKDWVDNTEWASVSATYEKVPEAPKEGVTAIGIHVSKVDEGMLQLTSWTKPLFKKDAKYVVEGWVRGKEGSGIKVGVRQSDAPYEFYAEQDLSGAPEWKPFSFEFSFGEDREAFVMFCKAETGAVDIAGIVVREKK